MALTLEHMVGVVERVADGCAMHVDRRSPASYGQQTLYFETGQHITIHENNAEVVIDSPNTGRDRLCVSTEAELEAFVRENLDTPARLAFYKTHRLAAIDQAYAQITPLAEAMVADAMHTVLPEIRSPYMDHLEKTQMIRDSFLSCLNRYENNPPRI